MKKGIKHLSEYEYYKIYKYYFQGWFFSILEFFP